MRRVALRVGCHFRTTKFFIELKTNSNSGHTPRKSPQWFLDPDVLDLGRRTLRFQVRRSARDQDVGWLNLPRIGRGAAVTSSLRRDLRFFRASSMRTASSSCCTMTSTFPQSRTHRANRYTTQCERSEVSRSNECGSKALPTNQRAHSMKPPIWRNSVTDLPADDKLICVLPRQCVVHIVDIG